MSADAFRAASTLLGTSWNRGEVIHALPPGRWPADVRADYGVPGSVVLRFG